jgi:NAD(P)H-hydrate epimerase
MTAYGEPVFTAAEMRAAEEGHDAEQLMERAGSAVAKAVLERFPEEPHIDVVAGGGANGGDARIAGRILAETGKDVRFVDATRGETEVRHHGVIIDGLFGTGFSGEPRPDALDLIDAINVAGYVVSVDIPSGVDASTGEVPTEAVHASHVVTFHGRKVGHEVTPGAYHAPSLEIADIGLVRQATEMLLATPESLNLIDLRSVYDNKYTAGSVLLIGGAPGYTGAICLAARAAFRADAGYVAVAVPDASFEIVEQQLVEPVKRRLNDVDRAAERASAIGIGPGLGRDDEAKGLVRRLLAESDLPMVVDGDALHELQPFKRDAPTILTPHEGELAPLIEKDSKWVAAHRLAALKLAVDRFDCLVVLKGYGTLIGAPGAGPYVCHGVGSLATAGTGDVLTGIISSFVAKDSRADWIQEIVAAGVVAHAEAARAVRRQPGLIAHDVIEALPEVLPYPW